MCISTEDATPIFKDYETKEIDKIKAECISKLNPYGITKFLPAFQNTKMIIDNINDRNKIIPVIIHLTDGLDFNSEETFNFIENDASYILNSFFNIYS